MIAAEAAPVAASTVFIPSTRRCNGASGNWSLTMRKLLLAAAMIGALIVPAAAEEKFSAMGAGWLSCTEFANAYRRDRSVEGYFFAWAQGYMSGLNDGRIERDAKPRQLNAISQRSQEQEVRMYCDDHPLAIYAQGVEKLFGSLPEIEDK
jgi:hypothetical protein